MWINTHQWLGERKYVVNTFGVSGTSLATANAAPTKAEASIGVTATNLSAADDVVNSGQQSTAGVTSTAVTNVYNQDSVSAGTTGLVTSSAAVSDNVTT